MKDVLARSSSTTERERRRRVHTDSGVKFEDLKSDLFAGPLKLAGAGETGP